MITEIRGIIGIVRVAIGAKVNTHFSVLFFQHRFAGLPCTAPSLPVGTAPADNDARRRTNEQTGSLLALSRRLASAADPETYADIFHIF